MTPEDWKRMAELVDEATVKLETVTRQGAFCAEWRLDVTRLLELLLAEAERAGKG